MKSKVLVDFGIYKKPICCRMKHRRLIRSNTFLKTFQIKSKVLKILYYNSITGYCISINSSKNFFHKS